MATSVFNNKLCADLSVNTDNFWNFSFNLNDSDDYDPSNTMWYKNFADFTPADAEEELNWVAWQNLNMFEDYEDMYTYSEEGTEGREVCQVIWEKNNLSAYGVNQVCCQYFMIVK